MPANPKYNKVAGFGFLGVIILVAVIVSAAFGGGMYWNETQKQQSLLQVGADAKKRAEDLKNQIESRDESIYGGSTSINSDGDTSGWKTYRNEKYGFEVKYPRGYSPEETSDSQGDLFVTFVGRGHFTARVMNRKFDQNNIEGAYGKIDNPKKTIIGGQVGYRFDFGDAGCGGPVIQTDLHGKVFEAYFGGCDDDQYVASNDETLIKQVLANFKFF